MRTNTRVSPILESSRRAGNTEVQHGSMARGDGRVWQKEKHYFVHLKIMNLRRQENTQRNIRRVCVRERKMERETVCQQPVRSGVPVLCLSVSFTFGVNTPTTATKSTDKLQACIPDLWLSLTSRGFSISVTHLDESIALTTREVWGACRTKDLSHH